MRKFKKLVIGGIENKVFNLILATVILIVAAFSILLTIQGNMLNQLVEDTSVQQQKGIEESMASVMDFVVDATLERTTKLEGMVAEDMLEDLQSRVELMAEYATTLFANPESVPYRAYEGPDPNKDGTFTVHALKAPGVEWSDPGVDERMGLVANMSDMMLALCNAGGADVVYIGMSNGTFLNVDDSPSGWFLEDGSLAEYDCRTRSWYQQAVETGGLIFSDIYMDANTMQYCVTCAKPVYDPSGELVAVAGGDLFLASLQDIMHDTAVEGSYRVLINQYGHVIYSSVEGYAASEADQAEDVREGGGDASALVTDALQHQTDVRKVEYQGNTYYMMGVPLKGVNWALISVFSEDVATQPAEMLQTQYREIEEKATSAYQREVEKWRNTMLIVLGLLVVVVATNTLILGKRIVRPLNTITQRIAEMRSDNLEFKMEDAFRTGDEIEVLAQSFADISHKTVVYMDEMQRVTAEKERIGTELQMATQIQEGMLPSIFPAFPDRKEFDIYANMNPAKEVGGDFYDFFLTDDDHLCMVMADVSGKGVPAALFMMASKIILQSVAMQGATPAQILERTNRTVCSNNKMEMFVTVWVGILEISTGKVEAANAGHEYPALKRGDSFELVKDKHGFVIGGMDGVHYKEYSLQLQPGDKLFVYTDGVPEATNADQELYGTTRMLDALNQDPDAKPDTMLRNVQRDINAFVAGADQFDDITMLCMEYHGPNGKA